MTLQVGIVGLPNVGKSTLFKALTRKPVDIQNYPFCTIEPNVGIVEVPDERLIELAKFSKTEKIIPTVIEFVDIAGLVEGANKGEGLGNKFLANIREVDVIAQVVRVFKNDDITHVNNKIDPVSDIEIIETELILADMSTVEKTIVRLEKLVKGGDKDATKQLEVVKNIKEKLDLGKLAISVDINYDVESVSNIIRDMALLTMKPIMYVYNVSDVAKKLSDELERRPHVKLDIKIEEELIEMTKEEAQEMEMVSHISDLIIKSFDLLKLQTFLTTGVKETRAWTIKKVQQLQKQVVQFILILLKDLYAQK